MPNIKFGLFFAHSGIMPFSRTLTEKLAVTMLAREGIAIIWRLHIDAATAYRTGHSEAATALLEIAEAAEEVYRSKP
jgi:hypothetical protein